MKVFLVVGARPNFMKAAPLVRALEKHDIDCRLIHTGQHYDKDMSDNFFEDLDLPKPHVNLSVGSSTHAEQTAQIMTSFEQLCVGTKPDVVIVVGDVNSTLACSLVTAKMENIKLAHVEAGLRSFDRTMPEEINRIVTDMLSDYLFCTDYKAAENLYDSKDVMGEVYIVGDVMVDTLLYSIDKISPQKSNEPYVLVTLHRPSNTDNKNNLEEILSALSKLAKNVKVIFPIHPRTDKKIDEFKLRKHLENIETHSPFGYMEFLRCMKGASVVLTDSGGIQVETTILNIYCVTMRENTEQGFTLTEGTNVLVGSDGDKIYEEVMNCLLSSVPACSILNKERKTLYDGQAADRIIKILMEV